MELYILRVDMSVTQIRKTMTTNDIMGREVDFIRHRSINHVRYHAYSVRKLMYLCSLSGSNCTRLPLCFCLDLRLNQQVE
jgi:hypothetical protein